MNNHPKEFIEAGPDGIGSFNSYLETNPIRFGSVDQLVTENDIIFVAVQTPHGEEFEGISRLPHEREDFDYSFLIASLEKVIQAVEKSRRNIILSIISTVLPGTFNKILRPILQKSPRISYVYNPAFIAMGTVMKDLVATEFVLLGITKGDKGEEAQRKMEEFYRTLTVATIFSTSVENAEVIKVLYNTYVSMKIVFANVNMELCHKLPNCDADEVVGALSMASKRIMSSSYLRGGMGDGGACHPRDNIALSWLSQSLNLSFDWFGDIMLARERQTEWLADLMYAYPDEDLPKTILGYAFKANTNITTGSAAILLKNIIEERGGIVSMYDPLIDGELDESFEKAEPGIFLIGTNHDVLKEQRFPSGSIVIDPWRFLENSQPDVRYVPVGGSRG